MTSHPPQSQTMLLSKRISTFLQNNISPHLHTLMLLTPTGKLLSTSSSSPASVLRHQGTLALSLWTLYSPFPAQTVSDALPPNVEPSHVRTPKSRETKSILIQMELGIMVIRLLACGLLFVAIGPAPGASGTTTPQIHREGLISISQPASPDGGHEREVIRSGEGSETASLRSARGGGVGISGMRRQAEELGKWLEGALDGLVLSTAER
ncbi:uncharacterized protein EAF01_010583 [Botrytis porri]|uniref:Uncharacterized protein n=1 Tax=Botrytis porri TaxID=87229 RepID=A0A4Z1KF26_9HELO|nr:uncharacterized protein EAF01_010583 [Botrytis porri]KAF7890774.1 hypothetical protein EAF01_010583 [Botrytis porri]TGO82134.1 hypothetical protein BPOR_0912g00030 [Botrytis porri]